MHSARRSILQYLWLKKPVRVWVSWSSWNYELVFSFTCIVWFKLSSVELNVPFFLHFVAHSFIWQLWAENKTWRGDPCGAKGFGIFKIRPEGAELRMFKVYPRISDSEICAPVYSPTPACFAAGTAQHYLVFHRMSLRKPSTHYLITALHLLNEIDQ